MNKKKPFLLAILCLVLFPWGVAVAQPKQVTIKSLTISSLGGAANSYGTMQIETDEFTDSASVNEWAIPSLANCSLCSSGTSLSTSYNLGAVRFGTFLPATGHYLYYYFENTAMSSAPIVIPYFHVRNRKIVFRMPAKIKGRLKVYDEAPNSGSRTLVYTADVDMEGSATINFNPLFVYNRKTSSFNSAVYTYLPVTR